MKPVFTELKKFKGGDSIDGHYVVVPFTSLAEARVSDYAHLINRFLNTLGDAWWDAQLNPWLKSRLDSTIRIIIFAQKRDSAGEYDKLYLGLHIPDAFHRIHIVLEPEARRILSSVDYYDTFFTSDYFSNSTQSNTTSNKSSE